MSNFIESFMKTQKKNYDISQDYQIHSCSELIECVKQVGFLPLLDSGIPAFCAEGLMAEECRFTQYEDGSWEWPLWQWKGTVVREGNCVYGKFYSGKAGFINREWWPDFCNWRRSQNLPPEEGTIEEAILSILRMQGSLISRDLRNLCGFVGPKMRGKFDSYINRLQMACYVVTEDFVYSRDKFGREYGFGLSLLTTPEQLLGIEACKCERTPQESYNKIYHYLCKLLPEASERQIKKILK